MTTTRKISSTHNAVIIYNDKDFRGRQCLVVRWPTGHKIIQFRRIKALIKWLHNNKYTPFVYDELPYRTRKTLDEGRATVVHQNAKDSGGMRMYRPRLGVMCPGLKEMKKHVPAYYAG